MQSLSEIFIPTSFGKIHGILSQPQAGQTPIVFIPGMLGTAEDWINDLQSFSNHPSVAISLRGRGKSDAPEAGFTIFDHAEDIKTVVDHLGWSQFHLVGFSQGALYAVAYALQNPDRIAGLVLQDKTLKQKKFGAQWVKMALQHPSHQSEQFLWSIANDSQDLNLLEKADSLEDTPTLLLKGGNSAMVMEEDLFEMKEVLKQIKVKIFPESGHDVSSPDYDLYIQTLSLFFEKTPVIN